MYLFILLYRKHRLIREPRLSGLLHKPRTFILYIRYIFNYRIAREARHQFPVCSSRHVHSIRLGHTQLSRSARTTRNALFAAAQSRRFSGKRVSVLCGIIECAQVRIRIPHYVFLYIILNVSYDRTKVSASSERRVRCCNSRPLYKHRKQQHGRKCTLNFQH